MLSVLNYSDSEYRKTNNFKKRIKKKRRLSYFIICELDNLMRISMRQ